jgi:hypothetical protein
MKLKRVTASLLSISVATMVCGCAGMQNGTSNDKAASAGAGAVIGCAGGAILAKLLGRDPAGGCVAGAVVGGLVGFEKARRQEVAAAEQAQRDAVTALQALPANQGRTVKAGEVKTVEVVATDKKTGEKKKYTAFSSVSVDIPLSARGTPEFTAAMGKLKMLAEGVANERGASEIVIAMTPQDAKLQKIALEKNTVKTDGGGLVTVSKITDTSLPKGMERVTVKAGSLNTEI